MKNPDKMSSRELRAEVKSHRWISVEDTLPQKPPVSQNLSELEIQEIIVKGDCYFDSFQCDTDVICAQGGLVYFGSFIYEKLDDEWIPKFWPKNGVIISDSEVTHWMPLPDAPL